MSTYLTDGSHDRQTWRAQAACARPEHRHLDWFPGRGQATRHLKAICATCPVRTECLDAALDAGEHHGIWGGLSERERRSERSQRPATRRPDNAARIVDHLRRFGTHRGSLAQLAAHMGLTDGRSLQGALARLEAAGTVVVDPPAPRQTGFSIRSISLAPTHEGTTPCA